MDADGPALFTLGGASDRAFAAFMEWAGDRELVRTVYTPDVLLIVDGPGRRGWMLDEVYFTTAWIDQGVDAFVDHLAAAECPGVTRQHPRLSDTDLMALGSRTAPG